MATEAKRGCGYRKIGGTYLESDPGGFACGRLPIPLLPCPLCDQRPAFTRGLQRITPKNVLHTAPTCVTGTPARCAMCPFGDLAAAETAGLMWVGGRFYTPESFAKESEDQGVSKRISKVPKWFEVAKTWVLLAHEQTFTEPCPDCTEVPDTGGIGIMLATEPCATCGDEHVIHKPGVFYAFKPKRIVRVIPNTMPEEERAVLREQGLTLVEVPHDDPDHLPARTAKERREEEAA